MRSVLLSSKMVRGLYMIGLLVSAVQVQATDWDGGIITSAESNIDTNFFISNPNILQGPVTVQAMNADVTATVGVNASLMSDAAPLSGRLHINAAAGRTVTFDLTNQSLTFVGSDDRITQMLVSFSGDGQLVFLLGDNERVAFAADELTSSAGTNFYVVMGDTGSGPTVAFTRANENSIANVEILVGRDSTMTYLAPSNDPNNVNVQGTIVFSPANQNTLGSMNLRILDRGAVTIAGEVVTIPVDGDFTNEDVDLSELGGNAANFSIVSTNTADVASLVVINSNTVLPRLRSEPFCDKSFTGALPGFVLGANGVITVGNGAYLDYIAASLNKCPVVRDCSDEPFDLDLDDDEEFSFLIPGVNINDLDVDDPENRKTQKSISCLDDDCDDELDEFSPEDPCKVCGSVDNTCGCQPVVRANQNAVIARNGSAFFVDGLPVMGASCFEDVVLTPSLVAHINLEGCSGIYFRSGVDASGAANEQNRFVINASGCFKEVSTPGAGNVLLDVEGQLLVTGLSADQNVLRILSDEVTKSGCPVVIADESPCADLTVFPALTHDTNFKGEFLRYNRGAFLINNVLKLSHASLVHTDDSHTIFDRDDLDRGDPRIFSEPTYIGGEFSVCCKPDAPRPTIVLDNSIIRFHTSAGFSGVDIQVPNNPTEGNNSVMRFYNNGYCVDRGTGRTVILGTKFGSTSCITGCAIDHNSHLDVFQTSSQATPTDQVLRFQTAPNDQCFTVAVEAPVSPDEASVQTVLLGNESNISIGTDPNTTPSFALTTLPTVLIDGVFFSFATEGGSVRMPELTGSVGEGAIFVDENGVFAVTDSLRANIGTVVVRSGNGVVDLPVTQVYFDSRVGVTNFRPDMTVTTTLVKPDEVFSDFILDWQQVKTDCTAFVPFDPKLTPLPCNCPPITVANVTNLPTILGTVEQLLVTRSRLGDQVNLLVGQGGLVRELIFLRGFNNSDVAMGTIVVAGGGQVGLGTANRNVDSLDANITLGINGVTIIANGNGVIELNENVIIDNVCHIMPGPDFGTTSTITPNTLVFFSNDACELRIKNTGVLDLSLFSGDLQQVMFAGNMRLVFEPGARMILSNISGDANRTSVTFTDTVSIEFERVFDADVLSGAALNAVENRVVKFSGNGNVVMNQGATLVLPVDTFMGIETDVQCTNTTDIIWTLNDQASFNIGTNDDQGGSLQVGNRTNVTGGVVNFELVVDGVNAVFQVKQEGVLSFGAGVVDKSSDVPNDWTFECLNNVGNVSISLLQGSFRHNQIFDGGSDQASLLVIGQADSYDFSFNVNNALILGGGNLALVATCTTTPPFAIPVTNVNGTLPGGNTVAGLMSSKDQLRDPGVFLNPPAIGLQTVSDLSPAGMFNYLHMLTVAGYQVSRAAIAYNLITQPTISYVAGTTLNRLQITTIFNVSPANSPTGYTRSVNRGAVNLNTFEGIFLSVSEIQYAA